MRITDSPASCLCGWKGTVGDCYPVYIAGHNTGSLACPNCGRGINIEAIRRQQRPGPSETK